MGQYFALSPEHLHIPGRKGSRGLLDGSSLFLAPCRPDTQGPRGWGVHFWRASFLGHPPWGAAGLPVAVYCGCPVLGRWPRPAPHLFGPLPLHRSCGLWAGTVPSEGLGCPQPWAHCSSALPWQGGTCTWVLRVPAGQVAYLVIVGVWERTQGGEVAAGQCGVSAGFRCAS